MNSETIQLEPDGKTIIIEKARIVDEELFNFFEGIDKSNRTETLMNSLISILKTGYVGTKRMINGGELDFIEKRFDTMARRFEEMFDPKVSSSFFNKLILLLKKYFDEGGVLKIY